MKHLLTALLIVFAGFGAACASEPTTARPNFVIFIGDDISADDFGCYGHPTIQTPNVDALAASGVRFANAYLTTSSCSPSRSSIITGRYPHNTGGPELHMKRNPHLARLPQFPRLLRDAGYYTALAGKAHFNGNASASFDRMYPPGDAAGMGSWMKALNERDKGKPFLMWLAAIDAHRPWDMGPDGGPHSAKDAVVPPYLVDSERTRTDLAQYYNEVHRFDKKIGEVVAALEAAGQLANTVIIVMADNGRPFPRCKTWAFDGGVKTPLVINWPNGSLKAGTREALVSSIDIAPTVLEMVGLAKPETVQGVSFAALLTDPAATPRDVVFAERNWHVYRHHDRMVRHGDYVYIKNNLSSLIGFNSAQAIHNRPEQIAGNDASADLIEGYWYGTLTEAQAFIVKAPCPDETLFNVRTDPHQINNLADDPAHAATLTKMRKLLADWTEQTGDTVPPMEKMTPDRNHRVTGEAIQPKGRPTGGVAPGESTQAWSINAPGPIRVGQ